MRLRKGDLPLSEARRFLALYLQGNSCATVGRMTGHAPSVVHRQLKRLGTKLRPSAGRAP